LKSQDGHTFGKQSQPRHRTFYSALELEMILRSDAFPIAARVLVGQIFRSARNAARRRWFSDHEAAGITLNCEVKMIKRIAVIALGLGLALGVATTSWAQAGGGGAGGGGAAGASGGVGGSTGTDTGGMGGMGPGTNGSGKGKNFGSSTPGATGHYNSQGQSSTGNGLNQDQQ
jgi:hypothetical protein